jgi:hypothetical protein
MGTPCKPKTSISAMSSQRPREAALREKPLLEKGGSGDALFSSTKGGGLLDPDWL